MSNGWGRNFEIGNNNEPGQAVEGYHTKDYPWMCMAYKVPNTGVKFSMSVHMRSDDKGKCTLPDNWCSIPAHLDGPAYAVGHWEPLIRDNKWHYKCINLHESLNHAIGYDVDHNIDAVIWSNRGGEAPTGAF